jgi:hypothetical protein
LLCYATERDDDVVEAALLQFEKMFAQREFVIIGEIQHVFGLRLWHAQNGLLDRTKDEVLQEGMAYIDDLYANKKLLPIPLNDYKSDVRFQGYGGLGIFCLETEEYRKLFDYMQARRKQALEDRYPEMASSLLEEMVSDPNLFVRRVCSNDSDDSIYARVPIMAAANAKTFVDTLLKQPPAHQEVILSAFTERYKFDRLNSELAPEKQWFAAVYAEMKRRLKKMTPVAQHRLRMYFRWHFEPVFVAEAD